MKEDKFDINSFIEAGDSKRSEEATGYHAVSLRIPVAFWEKLRDLKKKSGISVHGLILNGALNYYKDNSF